MNPEEFLQFQEELKRALSQIPPQAPLSANPYTGYMEGGPTGLPEIPEPVVPPPGPSGSGFEQATIPGLEQLPSMEPEQSVAPVPRSADPMQADFNQRVDLPPEQSPALGEGDPITSDALVPGVNTIAYPYARDDARLNQLSRSPEGHQVLIQEERLQKVQEANERAEELYKRTIENEARKQGISEENAKKKAELMSSLEKERKFEESAARERVAKREGEIEAARKAVKDVEAGKFFGDMGNVGKAVFAFSFFLAAVGDADSAFKSFDDIVERDIKVQMQNQKKDLENLYSMERALDKDLTFNEFLMRQMKEKEVLTREKLQYEIESSMAGIQSEDNLIKAQEFRDRNLSENNKIVDSILTDQLNILNKDIDRRFAEKQANIDREIRIDEAKKARAHASWMQKSAQKFQAEESATDRGLKLLLHQDSVEASYGAAQAKAAADMDERSFSGEAFGIFREVKGQDGKVRKDSNIVLKDKEARRELQGLAAQHWASTSVKNRILKMNLRDRDAYGNAEQMQAMNQVLSTIITGPGSQRLSDEDMQRIKDANGLLNAGGFKNPGVWSYVKGHMDGVDQEDLKKAIRASIKDDEQALEAMFKAHDPSISVNFNRGTYSTSDPGAPGSTSSFDRTIGMSGNDFVAVADKFEPVISNVPDWRKTKGGKQVEESFKSAYSDVKNFRDTMHLRKGGLSTEALDNLSSQYRALSKIPKSDRIEMGLEKSDIGSDGKVKPYITPKDPLSVLEDILIDSGEFFDRGQLQLRLLGE
jgi:hypothetical protein